MPQCPSSAHSYLFTVRLWWEDLGDGQSEWRGVVKLVTSGEEHFFRDWETLSKVMAGMLPDELPKARLSEATVVH